MNVPKLIAAYLQAQGVGTIGTNVFHGVAPPTPDSMVNVESLTSTRPTMVLAKARPVIEPYRFQIFTRAGPHDQDAAITLANQVRDVLTPLATGVKLDGHAFTSIQVVTLPAHFAVDARNRFVQQQVWEAWARP